MVALKTGEVILVNESDEWVGTMEKMQVHQEGSLHRAFSVFILNSENELLLQQRAAAKYHSGGLWSNTCCSHPAPGESTMAAAHRRLKEELGFDCKLEQIFTLRYNAKVDKGLTENEYDHIYLGRYSGEISPNEDEVQDHRYIPLHELQQWLQEEPALFTPWLHLALPRFAAHISERTVTI